MPKEQQAGAEAAVRSGAKWDAHERHVVDERGRRKSVYPPPEILALFF